MRTRHVSLLLSWLCLISACKFSALDAGSLSACYDAGPSCSRDKADTGPGRDAAADSGDAEQESDAAAAHGGQDGATASDQGGAGGSGGVGRNNDGPPKAGAPAGPQAGASGMQPPAGTAPPPPPSGAMLWLAADDMIEVDANGVIVSWSDRSGNERDAAPAGNAPAPRRQLDAGGMPYVFFDGTSELHLPAFPSFDELSYFAVVTPYDASSCRSLFHLYNLHPNGDQLNDVELGFHENQWYYENVAGYTPRANSGLPPLPTSTPLVLSLTHAAATTTLATARVNGQARQAPAPVQALDRVERKYVIIGNNGFNNRTCGRLYGEVREIVAYPRALSDAERDDVERFLARKWSVQLH